MGAGTGIAATNAGAGHSNAPAPTVGMEFVAVPALDSFVTKVAQQPDGALSEDDIVELCATIDAPELIQPLMELKQRQLRLMHKAKK